MIKQIMYDYLGTNGSICSPVHLEDIYYIRKYKLIADDKKLLVKGTRKEKSVLIPEDDLDNWKEVKEGQE